MLDAPSVGAASAGLRRTAAAQHCFRHPSLRRWQHEPPGEGVLLTRDRTAPHVAHISGQSQYRAQ